jgi:serine/threonine protein kinase
VVEQLPIGTVVGGQKGQYEIQGLVGRGGMGVVYRARRQSDATIWALKEQRPAEALAPDEEAESRQLFQQEAQLVLRLRHPNIVGGEELFVWRGRLYFVMEFVPGQTLERQLREANAPAFEQDALRWTIQMVRVFKYLHAQQPPIIYRDLKPANVMVLPSGMIKFIDFGVARTHKYGKTKDTVAIGTLGYAPPEQYGKGQTDARSDLYTLGATLYHLLTNLPPRPLYTPKLGEIQALNPSVQPRTEQVVIRAMQQDRGQRFASAEEMEHAMQACLFQPLPEVSPVPTPAQEPLDQTQRTAAPYVPSRARVQPVAAGGVPPAPFPPAIAPGSANVGQARFCPTCGLANKPSARFCATCGSVLPSDSVIATAAPPVQPAPPTLRPARFMVITRRGSWEFPLETLPCRIGRRDPSQHHYPELDLADYDRGHASRRHGIVERRGDQYVLTDVGSINGTLLNGVPLPPHRPHPLHAGDRVRIGDVELRFDWA